MILKKLRKFYYKMFQKHRKRYITFKQELKKYNEPTLVWLPNSYTSLKEKCEYELKMTNYFYKKYTKLR